MKRWKPISTILAITAIACCNHAAPVRGQEIVGKVVNTQSHFPIPDAVVAIKEKPQIQDISEKDGSFRLKSVPAGIYTLTATIPGFFIGEQVNVRPGHAVELDLTAISYGRRGVTPYANLDEAEARRLLPIARATGDTTGQYLLLNRLALSDPDQFHREANQLEQKLQLHPAELTGTVTSSGRSVANAEVKLTNKMTGDIVKTKTDSSGKYQVKLFPVGTYSAVVDAKGLKMASEPIEVPLRPNLTLTKDITVTE